MTQVQHPDPSWPYKGWPSAEESVDLDELASSGLHLFRDDFLFPVATISASALEHNIATVADFCRRAGLSLAPHAKTTMSPEIIQRQLSAGVWGITAATASQAQTFRKFGVGRILIAHQRLLRHP